jgi:F-type H+-transporting ATPase subunit b
MAELFANLGINGKLLLIQVINFLIIFAVLGKFVFPKIIKFVELRRKKIAEGLELTERAQHEMQRIEEARHRELERAKKEADAVLAHTKALSQERGRELLSQAKLKAEEIAQRAKEDAERAKVDAVKAAQEEISKAALFFAEKVLSRNIAKEDEERIAREVLEELNKGFIK